MENLNVLVLESTANERERICSFVRNKWKFATVNCFDKLEDLVTSMGNEKTDVVILNIDGYSTEVFDFIKKKGERHYELIVMSEAMDEAKILKTLKRELLFVKKPARDKQLNDALNSTIYNIQQKRLAKIGAEHLAYETNNRYAKYRETNISLSDRKGTQFVKVKDIWFVESKNTSSLFYNNSLIDGPKCLLDDITYSTFFSTQSIGEWHKKLAEKGIVRCHNQYLVNLEHIAKIGSEENTKLTLFNGQVIPISKMYKKEILRLKGE
ncbi:MAG: LytTR family DNA-binding domain-containing protein [Bacteroidota bacterium]